MLLPSIFGERLLDDWMDFPRMDFPDIDRKLYGKHHDEWVQGAGSDR